MSESSNAKKKGSLKIFVVRMVVTVVVAIFVLLVALGILLAAIFKDNMAIAFIVLALIAFCLASALNKFIRSKRPDLENYTVDYKYDKLEKALDGISQQPVPENTAASRSASSHQPKGSKSGHK